MRILALCCLTACSTRAELDGGVVDAGPLDAGPQAFCVPSSCTLGGAWQVSYAIADGGAGYCAPITEPPLTFVSDGGEVCMRRANAGQATSACELSFFVDRKGFDFSGSETWQVRLVDAGVLEGTLEVRMVFPPCDAAFSWRAVR